MRVAIQDLKQPNQISRGMSPIELDDTVRFTRDCIEAADSDPGWQESRVRWSDDMAFLDGEQWPAVWKQKREEEGRPVLTINKVRKYVNTIVGQWREQKVSIKVRPNDGKGDRATARVYEGLIRAIEYDSAADLVYQNTLEQVAGGGFGFWRVVMDFDCRDGFEPTLKIKQVHDPKAIYVDPLSREHDLSDARWIVCSEWMPRDEFNRKFPGKVAADIDYNSSATYSIRWYDTTLDIIRIAELWRREEVTRHVGIVRDDLGGLQVVDLDEESKDAEYMNWLRASGTLLSERSYKDSVITCTLVSGVDVLWGPKKWPGRYFPIVPCYGERTIKDGSMYLRGIVQGARDSQIMYNVWRSYIAEIMALQPKVPWIGKKGFAGEGEQKQRWEQSHRSAIPYLEFSGDIAPQRPGPPDWPQGIHAEATQNTQDLKETTGIYDPSLGNVSNETSGKAILYRQRQGVVTTSRYPESIRFAILHTGRVIVDLIPHVYTTARVVRIVDEDLQTVRLAAVNGAFMSDPMSPSGRAQSYDLLVGKYDVVVTMGSSYATKRIEAFEALNEMGAKLGPALFAQIADLVVSFGDFPGGEILQERLRTIMGQGGLSPEIQKAIVPLIQKVVGEMLSKQKADNVEPLFDRLNYKDAPEDIKRQIEMQAGLQPSVLPPPPPASPARPASNRQPGAIPAAQSQPFPIFPPQARPMARA